MRCYNCGCELTEHKFCTNCGTDVVLYKKIIKTSNFFYNQGLERAKVRDLSGAIVSLRHSLKFNKYNIKARNLLGLVYFETGEVAAALSEWVMSKYFKPKKNIADDYIEMIESNKKDFDNFNQATQKYNQALEYCKQPDGVDMAIIQLKRVITMNPKFLRAHQLLALCYLQEKKPDLARRELEKAKAIDVNNTTTLRYIAEVERLLTPVDGKAPDKAKKGNEARRYKPDDYPVDVIQPPPIKERRSSNTILNIIFGITIGLAIALFLILPARISKAVEEVKANAVVIGEQLDAKNLALGELEKKESEQRTQIAQLTETLNKYSGTEGTLLSMENLLKAASLYLENPDNYLEIADYISSVDEKAWTEETSENYKKLYYTLKKAIGSNVCQAYLKDGSSLYKAGEYEDAISYFEAAVFFDGTDAEAVYQLAVAYQAADKIDEAKLYYKKVVDEFPSSGFTSKASQALKKLNQAE